MNEAGEGKTEMTPNRAFLSSSLPLKRGLQRVALNSFRMAPNFSVEELHSPQLGMWFQPK